MCLRVNELRYGSKSGLKRIFVWGRVFVTEKRKIHKKYPIVCMFVVR